MDQARPPASAPPTGPLDSWFWSRGWVAPALILVFMLAATAIMDRQVKGDLASREHHAANVPPARPDYERSDSG